MNELLNGIIDMHIHTEPDTTKRNYNDFGLVDAANKIHAASIVIKCHHGSTVERAYLANLYNKEKYQTSNLKIFGGIVLNKEVGGLNPNAVEYALKLGGKIVWLPTIDAQNEYIKRGKVGGISTLDNNGEVKKELIDIFNIIKNYNAILATGHISYEETLKVVEAASKQGVKKIVITHPEYWIVNESIEQQKYLVDKYNVLLEKVYIQPLKDGHWVDNMETDLKAIQQIGYEHIMVATDSGYYKNDPWEIMLDKYVNYLLEHGISKEEVKYMTRVNQAKLLDLSLEK